MWFSTLELENIRSFETASLHFSKGINLLVGPNNCGKSTILLPLATLQESLPFLLNSDLRIGTTTGGARIGVEGDSDAFFGHQAGKRIEISLTGNNRTMHVCLEGNQRGQAIGQFPNVEPRNLIYPFLSKRKNSGLHEQVNDSIVKVVPANFDNLNSKIDRLINPEFPQHDQYMQACSEILGFRVTTTSSQQGKRAVLMVSGSETIPLSAMGEGVINILGLLVNLILAKDRVFLIEEPETDIHPRALKALLRVVAERACDNQFIITTHSNIVLKQLGAVSDTKIFRLDCKLPPLPPRLPTSTVQEVGPSSEDRRSVLEDLGYELHDVDLWSAWLLLEESSAEKIVRAHLIPWFTPELQSRLRTYSAHSLSEIPHKFRDFNDLFVFLHLTQVYKNRAWVLVDAGEQEAETIRELRETYPGWDSDSFRQLKLHDFERYFPRQFAQEVDAALGETDKQARRAKKKRLLDAVEAWINENPEVAKRAFEESAAEVIALLKEISRNLGGQ